VRFPKFNFSNFIGGFGAMRLELLTLLLDVRRASWSRRVHSSQSTLEAVLRLNLVDIRRHRYCLPCRCHADDLVLHGTFSDAQITHIFVG
jgi:hypothetical protein